MKDTTKVMGNMNKMMKPQDVMKNMQDFERESAKLEMSEEVMNDTLGRLAFEALLSYWLIAVFKWRMLNWHWRCFPIRRRLIALLGLTVFF